MRKIRLHYFCHRIGQLQGIISFINQYTGGRGGYEVIPSSRENMRLLKRSSGSCGIFSGKISQMKVMSL